MKSGQLQNWLGFLSTFVLISVALRILQLPSTILPLLNLKALFRKWNRWIISAWAFMIVLTTQWFSPTMFVLSGETLAEDDTAANDNIIVMTNHQTFADWWYLWCLAYNRKCEGFVKIILKHSLKYIPLWGPGMQNFEFVFLRRKWEDDVKIMTKSLAVFTEKSSQPFWLVIFPEGTIIRDESRQKARQYAIKEKLPILKHQLVPRITGLKFCVDKLRGCTSRIVDITIGYKGVRAGQNASEVYKLRSIFLDGHAPPEIHMHIRSFSIADIPTDENGFSQWTMERFREKVP